MSHYQELYFFIDINYRYSVLKNLVEKDLQHKQTIVAKEKAINEESAKLLKWLKATQGKLDHSPLEGQAEKLEEKLKAARVSRFYLFIVHLLFDKGTIFSQNL